MSWCLHTLNPICHVSVRSRLSSVSYLGTLWLWHSIRADSDSEYNTKCIKIIDFYLHFEGLEPRVSDLETLILSFNTAINSHVGIEMSIVFHL